MISTISSHGYSEKERKLSPINRYVGMRAMRALAIRKSRKSAHNHERQPNFVKGSLEARMQSENLGIVFLD